MEIIGYKSGGHDASVCLVRDGTLVFSIEGEKNSRNRHALFESGDIEAIFGRWQCRPDAVCGDSKQFGSQGHPDNYFGYERERVLYGDTNEDRCHSNHYSVPHELAHIACSYALSPLPEQQPFYALVWEGLIGRLYRVDEHFNVTKLGHSAHVLDWVGVRYCFPYHATGLDDALSHKAAGKIMALAGLADTKKAVSPLNKRLVELSLDSRIIFQFPKVVTLNFDRHALYDAFEPYRGINVTDSEFVQLCKALQDGIFDRFLQFVRQHAQERLPLVISGGCGLNCSWNTLWRESELFESVFVPPITNDSGIAIGAAAVVQHLLTDRMKLEWNVYAGEEFEPEPVDFAAAGFVERPLDNDVLARLLYERKLVVAWVQGRYEIGPRALCNRSLIAAPFDKQMQDELNRIKRREPFRPIAPVCMEADVGKHFAWSGASPHMLYFQKVTDPRLQAVTHTDGTARVQTITREQNRQMYDLLGAFKKLSGVGVLCNTSLNFSGRGFINGTFDLLRYVREKGISTFVINDRMYLSATVVDIVEPQTFQAPS